VPLAVALLVALFTGPASRPLTVSAAVSLTNALDTLGPKYTKTGGAQIRFNYGPSNTLARQIVRGAPVDVFISADEAQMDVAEKAGAIAPATRVRLLGNRLVLITSRTAPSGVRALAGSGVRRIAIADPEAVPAGVYAKQVLVAEGLWQGLQSKLVPVGTVRAALAAVENQTADAAFVYESDAVVSGRVNISAVWKDTPRIVYPAAIVKASGNQAEAARFLKFLCGDEAAAVFRQQHFIPLGCK
jgi:molybdate transport system substrate-binding protein